MTNEELFMQMMRNDLKNAHMYKTWIMDRFLRKEIKFSTMSLYFAVQINHLFIIISVKSKSRSIYNCIAYLVD